MWFPETVLKPVGPGQPPATPLSLRGKGIPFSKPRPLARAFPAPRLQPRPSSKCSPATARACRAELGPACTAAAPARPPGPLPGQRVTAAPRRAAPGADLQPRLLHPREASASQLRRNPRPALHTRRAARQHACAPHAPPLPPRAASHPAGRIRGRWARGGYQGDAGRASPLSQWYGPPAGAGRIGRSLRPAHEKGREFEARLGQARARAHSG